MSFDREPITDLDLMAYADGRLDPVRRHAVEAHLAGDPEARALAQTFIEQNASLQRSLAPIAAEPVPDRLVAVLERGTRSRSPLSLLQAAAVLGVAVLSGLGGWWLGTRAAPVAGTPPAFLAGLELPSIGAVVGSLEPRAESAGEPATAAPREPTVVERTAPWFSDRLTVELRAPALGDQVASPELQRLIEIDGEPTVRFELAGPDGGSFILYLQARPSGLAPDIHIVESARNSTAYWQDGPLVWALTGDAPAVELQALAEQIGTAIELEPRLGTVDAEHTELQPLPLTFAGGQPLATR